MLACVLMVWTCGCGGPAADAGAGTSPEAIASVTLTPAPAGAPLAIAVPGGAAQVRFSLSGLPAGHDDLVAELEAVGGDRIRRWRVDGAPGDEAPPSVVVPIYEVPAGEHLLTVWAGDAEVVGRYAFRVDPP